MTQEQERQPGHLGAGGEGGDERRGHGSPALDARARCEVRRHTRRWKGCSPNDAPAAEPRKHRGSFPAAPARAAPSSSRWLNAAQLAALRSRAAARGDFRTAARPRGEETRGNPASASPYLAGVLLPRGGTGRAGGRERGGARCGARCAALPAGPSAGLGATNKVPERRGRAPGSGNSRGAERSRAPSAGPPRPGHSPCPSPRPGRAVAELGRRPAAFACCGVQVARRMPGY